MKITIKDNAITEILKRLYRDKGVGYKEPAKVFEAIDKDAFENKLINEGQVVYANDTIRYDIVGMSEEEQLEFFRTTLVGATIEEVIVTDDDPTGTEKTTVVTGIDEESGGWVYTTPGTGVSMILNEGFIRISHASSTYGSSEAHRVKKITLADGTVLMDENSKEVKYASRDDDTVLNIYKGDIDPSIFTNGTAYRNDGQVEGISLVEVEDGVFEYRNEDANDGMIIVTTKDNAKCGIATLKDRGIYLGGYIEYDTYFDEDGKEVTNWYELKYFDKVKTDEIKHKIDAGMIEPTE